MDEKLEKLVQELDSLVENMEAVHKNSEKQLASDIKAWIQSLYNFKINFFLYIKALFEHMNTVDDEVYKRLVQLTYTKEKI